MAAQVTRRDVGALILLIALELGLLCLLGVTFRADGATRMAARIEALTYFWPALGPEPLPPEPVEAAPPFEATRPVEPARAPARKAPPAPAVAIAPDVAPAAPIAIAPRPPVEEPPESDAAPSNVVDPCGGDLCCVAPAAPLPARSAEALPPEPGPEESLSPDRMVITWPASRRDDVVYRVFTLPGRRFVGSSGQNWFVHLRKPDDPDCYKIQACDRSGTAADGPLTICIKRRRTWG
jgi:hypothetical protein